MNSIKIKNIISQIRKNEPQLCDILDELVIGIEELQVNLDLGLNVKYTDVFFKTTDFSGLAPLVWTVAAALSYGFAVFNGIMLFHWKVEDPSGPLTGAVANRLNVLIPPGYKCLKQPVRTAADLTETWTGIHVYENGGAVDTGHCEITGDSNTVHVYKRDRTNYALDAGFTSQGQILFPVERSF